MRNALFILLFLCFCAGGLWQDNSNESETDTSDPDCQRLLNAPYFADGVVGEGGEIPEEIYALNRLVKKTNARQYLYKLAKEAGNEGKMYALCGLYDLDQAYFFARVGTYRISDETVVFMAGCIRMNEYPVRKLMEDFANGVIPARIKQYGQE